MFGSLFNKSSFGLDIEDDSIKFVELIDTKNGIRVGRHGERMLPTGVIEEGKIKNAGKLAEILLSLKKEKGIKSAHVSLPIPEEEEYLSVFKKAGIKVRSFEEHLHAVSRSLVARGDMGTYMIVNFSRQNSGIFVISGGVAKNRLPAASEVYLLGDEVARAFLHWHTQKDREIVRLPIKKIILYGSGSGITELGEHLTLHLRRRVELGNAWNNILDTAEHIPEISHKESFGYAPALGAALRGVKR